MMYFYKKTAMLSKLLLPHRFKKWGWVILLIFIPLGVIVDCSNLQFPLLSFRLPWIPVDPFTGGRVNFTNTLAALGLILGFLLVAFSREAHEDEYVAHVRLESLLWAVLVNYILLAVTDIFLYGSGFLEVMVYNMFTPLVLFIARFHLVLYGPKNQMAHEK